MTDFMLFALLLAAAAMGVAVWRIATIRARTRERLWLGQEPADEVSPASAVSPRLVRRFPARWRWAPWVVAAGVGLVAFVLAWSPLYVITLILIVGLLGSQFEEFLAMRRVAMIERQLADAVDLMVGALGAGAGVVAGLEAAARESKSPLQEQLEDVLARIRYGDDPRLVFRTLADRIPLESFLLFASTLAVQWEVGGSLAPTLSSIARMIRDRVEVARRLQSSVVQSQISTIAVLGLTYLVAIIVWRSNPSQMSAFLASASGHWLIAATVLMQALGIAWMSRISRMKF